MKTFRIMVITQFLLLLSLLAFLGGCKQYSETVKDKSAGLNGGFEVSKNGLPVNWLMYTSNTVPDADFEIVLDKDIFKEGKQSLKFDVQKCSSTGGWLSPGFTNEFFEIGKYKGEGLYNLSFWIMNNGTRFNISAGGVAALVGDMKTLIEGNDTLDDWKFFEYKIEVHKDRWLRLQLNILHPGTFWIDDIKIEKIKLNTAQYMKS